MVRPLYQPRSGAFPQRYERGHAGLWYDKFCDRWAVKTWQLEANDPGGGKLGWINTLTGQPLGQRQQLQEEYKLQELQNHFSLQSENARLEIAEQRYLDSQQKFEAERILVSAGVDPGARGESLDIAQFARIASARALT